MRVNITVQSSREPTACKTVKFINIQIKSITQVIDYLVDNNYIDTEGLPKSPWYRVHAYTGKAALGFGL